METKSITWNDVLSVALRMPGIQVHRDEFLKAAFAPYGTQEQVELLTTKRPIEVYSQRTLNKVAHGVIQKYTVLATAASTVAGLPGGWGMAISIPADMAQFYVNLLRVTQELAYIYGYQDLANGEGKLDQDAQTTLTVFVAVAMGIDGAEELLRKTAKVAAEKWAKKVTAMALTKTNWYPIVKKVASYIGIKITKKTTGKVVGKAIPVIGGAISGTMTYVSFKPMTKRLKSKLIETQDILQENCQEGGEQTKEHTNTFEDAEVVE